MPYVRNAPSGTSSMTVLDVCRSRGRVVYLRPGHETHPTYFDPNIRRLLANSARWAAEPGGARPTYGPREWSEPD